jgi:hypothetical protein
MEVERLRIKLREDGGSCIVSQARWALADLEPLTRELTRHGILSHATAEGVHVLYSTRFVGSVTTERCRLEVTPKYPFAFKQMRMHLRNTRHRENLPSTTVGGAMRGSDDIPAHFVRLLAVCVDSGLPVGYTRRTIRTTHPRGRLKIHASIREWTKGAPYRVVCEQPHLDVDADFRTLVTTVAALVQNNEELATADLSLLDTCIQCVGDQRPVDAKTALSAGRAFLTKNSASPESYRTVEVGMSLLDETLPTPTVDVSVQAGVARFLRTDRLWEQTVVSCLRDFYAHSQVRFHPLSGAGITLLSEGGPEIDPDVIIYQDNAPLAVCDAKWKGVTSSEAPDVYQVMAYAEKVQAPHAVLVYIDDSDRGWCRCLGKAISGVTIWELGAPPSRVVAGLRQQMAAFHDAARRPR